MFATLRCKDRKRATRDEHKHGSGLDCSPTIGALENESLFMIRDLSLTLQAILDDPALGTAFPELAAAQIVFDRPTESFTPAQTTVDLFLYDIRENMELRTNEPIIQRNNGQATIHRPSIRLLCSYLLTAWPVGGAEPVLQEHRLLSQAMQVLSQLPNIPAAFLKGKLAGQDPPLPMMTARAEGLKDPAEFWTAIGNKLRASLTVTVTLSMEAPAPETAHMVAESEIRIGERTSPFETKIATPTLRDDFRITGQVTGAGDVPVAGARVSITQIGLAAVSDREGRYTLGMMPAGSYTLRAESGPTAKNVNIVVPAPAGRNFNVKLTG